MNFIYFGTGHFSRVVLEGLLNNGCSPMLVVTQPDRPKGRGLKFVPSLVAGLAEPRGLNVIKPETIKNSDFIDLIRKAEPDFILVADYGKILPQAILDLSKYLSFAVHPSSLPLYRGATPLNRPIINGDKETGVTIFKMAATMDSGAVIAQKILPITDEDTVVTMTDKLAHDGAVLAADVLKSGEFKLIVQDEAKATYAPKFCKEDGLINWKKSPVEIRNFIRGTMGWPSAYTFYNGKKIQILRLDVVDGRYAGEPGTVLGVSKDGIDVVAGSGIVRIVEVKPEGKNSMPAHAFACGNQIRVGDSFNG